MEKDMPPTPDNISPKPSGDAGANLGNDQSQSQGSQSQSQQPAQQQSGQQNNPQLNQFQQQQQQLASPAVSQDSFLGGYQPAAKSYNEQIDARGQIRSQWKSLDQDFALIGREGMDRRRSQIRRMVYQNGIAFSAYGDPRVREKHLQLDPIPHLIPSKQWETLSRGLQQRATLLNKLLADLYGPRSLITSGVLPQEVLFRHPHFQLPYCCLLAENKTNYLHLYGAELICSPSGDWWVMADRTDSPGGCGFALENRLAISRAFPNEFRKSNVQRMAPFFMALRNRLKNLSPRNIENPHIAILSAGTGSKSYFEDSFLARYLGYTLVEANDLVVRSGKVMLKTLAGLTQVDVIMRRQQGDQLDPLEMGGSAPGIAGILQVIREGNVAVASVPGSGLVESPIFMAFMPAISQALMQTDLELPGVATWWAGQTASRELILDRIEELVLLPAFRQRTVLGVDVIPAKLAHPEEMTREEKIQLVRENPSDWVAQELVSRSSAAVWDDGELKTGYLSLRTFLVAQEEGWNVMPGGLMRVSDTADEPILNPFEGGGAKDAWVQADDPVELVTLLSDQTPIGSELSMSRGGGYLSSRIANNLCWLGRYLERTDAAARLLREVLSGLIGEASPAETNELQTLVRALAADGRIDAGLAIREISQQMPALDRCLSDFTLDRTDPNSLRSLVDLIVSQAAGVRERLSADAWRTVQNISSNFESSGPDGREPVDLLDITNELILNLASFSGLASESMTRTHAFRFLNIGRRLERGLQIVGLLQHTFLKRKEMSIELLESVLGISDSVMTYRYRYYANVRCSAVLDLLLADETNPRSLAFQLVELNASLEALPGNSGSNYSEDRRLAMDALHTIRMLDIDPISESYVNGDAAPLRKLLMKMERRLPDISTAISNRFLVHSGPIQQLVSER